MKQQQQVQHRSAAEMIRNVALEFTRLIREQVGETTFAEIKRRNAAYTELNDGCCATQDFCDANVFMCKAMANCGVIPSADDHVFSEADFMVWEEAWNAARHWGLIEEVKTCAG